MATPKKPLGGPDGRRAARLGREMARIRAKANAHRDRQRREEEAARAKEQAKRGREEAAAEREKQRQETRQARREKQKGKQDKEERAEEHKKSVAGSAVGGAVGRRAGMAIGAAVGGPVGAAIGGVVGGLAGSAIGGRAAGKRDAETDEANGDVGPMGMVKNVADQTEKALKLVGNAARFASEGMQRVAGNDGVGLFQQGMEKTADVMERIPLAGKALGEGFRTLGTVVGSVNQVAGAFAARGRELSGFDPRIAGATARQDVTRLLGDIRESQKLGGGYGALIDKITEFEETVKVFLLPIKNVALDVLPKMLDWMLDFSIWAIEALDKVLIGDYGLKTLATEMRKAREDARRGAGAEFDLEAMFRAARDRPIVFPAPFAPVPAGGPGGLGIPLVPPRIP